MALKQAALAVAALMLAFTLSSAQGAVFAACIPIGEAFHRPSMAAGRQDADYFEPCDCNMAWSDLPALCKHICLYTKGNEASNSFFEHNDMVLCNTALSDGQMICRAIPAPRKGRGGSGPKEHSKASIRNLPAACQSHSLQGYRCKAPR